MSLSFSALRLECRLAVVSRLMEPLPLQCRLRESTGYWGLKKQSCTVRIYCRCMSSVHSKPVPGSEQVSPVSSAANYPLGVTAAAASVSDMAEDAAEMASDSVVVQPGLNTEKELATTDADLKDSDIGAAEHPVSVKQGEFNTDISNSTTIYKSS